jgi:epoxyqueuosine reductase
MRGPLTASEIKAKALEVGFDACGIAPAADHPELRFFSEWIARGYAGTMGYLPRSAERRADVRNILPSARTVIVTATVYNTDRAYSVACGDPDRAHIARYAWGDDYHEVLAGRLNALLDWMRDGSDQPFDARTYVDTGPVQERVYAQYAGLGWIGKNTCVIHPELGSWIFLAEIICSLPLDPDVPSYDQCGTCTLCLEACPTQAIVEAGVLDATRCISYLTIEHRGEIPKEFEGHIGGHVYGCDICQEVCPWNAVAPVSTDQVWQPRVAWDRQRVTDLARMSDDELGQALKGSAMDRAKPAGIRRNVDVSLRSSSHLG